MEPQKTPNRPKKIEQKEEFNAGIKLPDSKIYL